MPENLHRTSCRAEPVPVCAPTPPFSSSEDPATTRAITRAMTPSGAARVQDYLDHVLAPLVEVISYEQRQQIRGELAAHVESLTAAYQDLGADPDKAVSEALRQLGHPRMVTRHWRRAQYRQSSTESGSARQATVVALAWFGAAYLADTTTLAARLWASWGLTGEVAFYRTEVFLVPLLAGLATGLLSRQQPVRGVANALALLAIPALLLPGILLGLHVTGLWSVPMEWNALGRSVAGLVGLITWAPLGCLSAAGGGWLRKRGLARVGRRAFQ